MAKKKKDAVAVFDPTQYAVTVPSGRADLETLLQGGVGVFDMTRMKVPGSGGSSWEIETLHGLESLRDIEVVIMLVQGNQKAWWREPYGSGGGNTPPNCSSVNARTGTDNPSREEPDDGKDVQGVHNCITCPWNAWKSAKRPDGTQGRGKDCKDFAMIFLYRPGSRTPTMLTVSPTSLKPMRRYSIALMDAGKDVTGVVTRLSLNPTQNSDGVKYSEIEFEFAGDLPDDAAAEVKQAEAIMADYLATHTVTVSAEDLHEQG